MKYTLFLVFIAIFLTSCADNKETPTPEPTKEELILGQWNVTDYNGETSITYEVFGIPSTTKSTEKGKRLNGFIKFEKPNIYEVNLEEITIESTGNPLISDQEITLPPSQAIGTWSIQNDSLVSDIGINAFIKELNDSILILETAIEVDTIIPNFEIDANIKTQIAITYKKE